MEPSLENHPEMLSPETTRRSRPEHEGGGRSVGFTIPLADTQAAAHRPAAEFPVEECS